MPSEGPRGLKGTADERDQVRKQNIDRARALLGGGPATAATRFDLAKDLKETNDFGLARRLLASIRQSKDYSGIRGGPILVAQQCALCTYKDADLQAGERYRIALAILDEISTPQALAALQPTTAENQETLGLRGSVYKRRWRDTGSRSDLEQSLSFYLAGHQPGPATDHGYNGINAAFVLDLLAAEEARAVAEHPPNPAAEDPRALVARRREQAQRIRLELIDALPKLSATAGQEWLKYEWWFYGTLAEAHFGIGAFDDAIAVLRSFNAAADLRDKEGKPLAGPPVDSVPSWLLESTIAQLAALAEAHDEWRVAPGSGQPSQLAQARRALRGYLGERFAPAVDRAFEGKLGLGLSGGGFRASFFHIGVLALLADRHLLQRIEVLSCVSGGSIVGAHYYLKVQQLLTTTEEKDITPQHYKRIVKEVEEEFLAGVQENIRCRLFADIGANLRAFLQPGYSTTRRLGALYERWLYRRVTDGKEGKPRRLRDLLIRPLGEGSSFRPKYENWRRKDKVPIVVFNATTLNTGHNWQFTASWMGEPPSSLDAEIEGGYRLRRVYHDDAPPLASYWKWPLLSPFAPIDYQNVRLGEAVAASSCVPGLFDPLFLPDLYEGKQVRLVDGGVYDNQGVASLLEQDCTRLILSDASGQMDATDKPGSGRLGVVLRSSSVSMARVRHAQYLDIDARGRSGLIKRSDAMHLTLDLDKPAVAWRGSEEPPDLSDERRTAVRDAKKTSYGIDKGVQGLLAGIRTDLDSFTEVEAFALMTSGYRMAESGVPEMPPRDQRGEMTWRFLEIERLLDPEPRRGDDAMPSPVAFEDATRQLKVSGMTLGKAWELITPLRWVKWAVLGAALAWLGWFLFLAEPTALLTTRGLGKLLIGLALAAAPSFVQTVWSRRSLRWTGLQSLAAAVIAIAMKLHLWFIDPIYLRRGRLARLQKLEKR